MATDRIQVPRWRVFCPASALALVALALGAPDASPTPSGQQVASFVVAYKADYRSSLNALYVSKGRCGDRKGTVETLETSNADTAFRARVLRTPIRGGYAYGILPGKGRELEVGPALAMRFTFTETTNIQVLEAADDAEECGVFRPSRENGTRTSECTVKGSLVFIEDRGRVTATFRRGRTQACDGDGYPGRTNELRLRGKVRPADLARRKRNVITARGKKTYHMPPDSEDNADRHEAGEATWKLTLQRTSAWKQYRR